MAHGPAVPAATMKLCTQWGEYSEVGNDVSSGGIRRGAGRGNSFGAPTRWRDTFLGRGCTDECLPFCLPFYLSLSLSTNLHDYYLLPSPSVFRGTELAMETWSRLLSILSHERASNGSISIALGIFQWNGIREKRRLGQVSLLVRVSDWPVEKSFDIYI